MPNINRPAIEADIGKVAVRLDKSFDAVVAIQTERLQRTEPESIPVAAMRPDMIGNNSRFHNAALQAQKTKRVFPELETPALFPLITTVPFTPWRLLPC